MDAIEIEGGVPLKGEVEVSGSKNATLPQIAAALLSPGRSVFRNVPELADIRTMGRLLSHMGAKVARDGETGGHTLEIDAAGLPRPEAPYELVKTMRASVLVLGPLVARMGRARVSLPGGCAIGARPIDLHIKGLERLGATITQEHGFIEASAERLKGGQIVFDKITVTGTEDLMMAAALAEGETLIENCAREPEVSDLAALLNKMGARIEGAGTSTIRIQGVEKLHGARHRVIPDRIEAGTFIIAGVLAGGELTVANCEPRHLGALLQKLEQCGARVQAN